MESFGNFFDEEWHNLDRMFCTDEGLGFRVDECSDHFVGDEERLINVSDIVNPNFYHFFSQENSISSNDASNGTISNLYPNQESFPFCHSHIVPSLSNDVCDQSVHFRMMNEINNSPPTTQLFSEGSLYLTQDLTLEKVGMENPLVSSRETALKRKFETPVLPDAVDVEVNNEETDKNPKKRIRVSRDNTNKKSVQLKKNQKMNDTEERNKKNNREMNGQSSSSCSSNDDLNLSQDPNGAGNLNGKTRASRGAATDPQSLYARNLVPNGTKVDISTMLEEAVEYVKFLKLQIQLLSSDDMWMYAPIAYNGMDMGLYQNISQNLRN
ncbi:hypothetical protein L1987_23052 [Smallanthus sonchifolius]|uniref:Uncharacterized protein n=1 Tax=Smallanthus sonchifolius TaxID=185202 RepID=A0ACB9IFU5_9ASTR|nr:hypothetical protein L1987_23052 [Smallanthus sonchifolius]